MLPIAVCDEINLLVAQRKMTPEGISEIRLRVGKRASLSLDRLNYLLEHICTPSEMNSVMKKLCAGSVYAFEGSLKEGFIATGRGVRVAVNTSARRTGGETVRDTTPVSIVFRIPIHTEGQSMPLAALMAASPGGMLVFSPPAVGKTTLLRDLIVALSGPEFSLRVAVVDSRGEIDDGLIPSHCLTDTISGCGREEGIEWALRTLSPQIIAVDELNASDIPCVCRGAACGVPVIATMHGDSYEEILGIEEIASVFKLGAFRYIVRLTRKRGFAPEFEVMTNNGKGGLAKIDI